MARYYLARWHDVSRMVHLCLACVSSQVQKPSQPGRAGRRWISCCWSQNVLAHKVHGGIGRSAVGRFVPQSHAFRFVQRGLFPAECAQPIEAAELVPERIDQSAPALESFNLLRREPEIGRVIDILLLLGLKPLDFPPQEFCGLPARISFLRHRIGPPFGFLAGI